MRNTIELSGDMVIAIGKVIAIAAPPPNPGKAPKNMPRAMPPAAIASVSNVSDVKISSTVRAQLPKCSVLLH